MGDPYMVRKRPKSVLCAPIMNRGKFIGLLYLENNLTTGAFTNDRLVILRILAAQAAISLENAILYRTLAERVDTLTAQLAQAHEEIAALKVPVTAQRLSVEEEANMTH